MNSQPNDMMMGQVTQMGNSSFNEQGQNVQSGGDDRNHPDSEKVRRFVQKKIYEYLMVKGQQQSIDVSAKRMIDLTGLLDKGLFNAATTVEEYMNLESLETRLLLYLKQLRNSHTQRLQQMSSGLEDQLSSLNLSSEEEEIVGGSEGGSVEEVCKGC